jgi:hypothetical protein
MNSGAQVALAVGAGYLLGRQHKMRWALALGAVAATGQLGRGPGALLERGGKVLDVAPELGKLGESGGRLLQAARNAALTEVSSRIDAFSGSLQDRASTLTRREQPLAGETEEPEEPGDTGETGEARERRPGREPGDESEEEGAPRAPRQRTPERSDSPRLVRRNR